ncbi:unnamed protein product [Dovyalis caffra]|uniref:Uncharacterized protein n=1 Tax=Dovyalis caffra TaxID=77055 RepID=A0AAV1S7M4_9ROSI|nr:unnamed protein product [Dovyalis caffra]
MEKYSNSEQHLSFWRYRFLVGESNMDASYLIFQDVAQISTLRCVKVANAEEITLWRVEVSDVSEPVGQRANGLVLSDEQPWVNFLRRH